MEIFGVGPLEFILILVLALIILGPEDMVGTARRIGQWVYRVVRSPTWRSIIATSQDLRELPTKIVRDAGLEETMNEIKQTANEVKTDLNDTTREINAEMQAATSEVNREMQTAALDANAGMKEASAEAQIAMQSTAAGLAGSENTIAPPQGQVETTAQAEGAAILEEPAPTPEVVPQLSPYEIQLGTIATGLGGKEIQSLGPAENTIFHVVHAKNALPAALTEAPSAPELTRQPYAARLEMFAQALGATTGSSQKMGQTTLEEQPPTAAEPAPAPWAIGIPVGLDLNSGGGMDALIKQRVDKMAKSIEELDAKIESASGGEGASTPPQTDESAPISTPADPQANDTEPAAPPAGARRNTKRAAPDAEVLKAPPRKRTAKTKLSTAETADSENTAKASRKRVTKVSPPAAEAVEEGAPKPAPRKRTPKKTPVETSVNDSPSTQA